MKLALEMPSVGPAFQSGRVIKWSKAPGEPFTFGDELCVVSIEQVMALRKTQQASILSSRRSKRKMRDQIEQRETSGLHFQLVASEDGVLLDQVVAAGAQMKIGDVLAVLGSGDAGDDQSPLDPAALPTIRVVANPVDPEED